MTTIVNTFAALRAAHANWEALKSHLISGNGGNLRVIENGSRYAVIRYVKGDASVGHFRSVVWDTVTHLPVCVAPFKAEEGSLPINVEGVVSEFLDGFMVNAFVTADGVLELATRTCTGGGNNFYSQKTFGQMFDEAIANTPYKDRAGVVALVGGAGGFVSFLMQHPEHRVVAKVARPAAHVIHTGRVDAEGVVTLVRPDAPPHAFKKLYATQEEVEETMRRMGVQMGWRWQGLCFHDAEGRRWRVRSPTYTLLRELRGAEAGSLERFLRLRAEKRVGEYLKHYSEDRTTFWGFEQKLRAVTGGVLAAYNDCHKAHAVAFKDLPEAVKPAVYMLHVKWLQELRPKGFVVRVQNVIEVVNGLRAFEQRRLVEGDVYVPAAPAAKPTEGQYQAEAEESSKAAAAVAAAAGASV
jgi:hypothetical protein